MHNVMKKSLLFVLLLFLLISSVAGENYSKYGYSFELSFYDDFDANDINEIYWNIPERSERQKGMKNHGWWIKECVFLDNGKLVIEGKNRNGELSSGAVNTKGKFEQNRGLYEIRFRCSAASGLWYAFWLMGKNNDENIGNDAEDAAEIDVFEIIQNENGKKVDKIYSTLHWDSYGEFHKKRTFSRKKINNDFYNKWHDLSFLWGYNSYSVYLDDVLIGELDCSNNQLMCEGKNWIVISSEFGSWGGDIKEELFPYRFEIDYIKVYKLLNN